MRMPKPMWFVGLACASVLGTAVSLVPAAQAADDAARSSQTLPPELRILGCSHSWSDKDNAEADIDRTAVSVRSGPHATSDGGPCTVLFQLNRPDHVYYHCYTTTNSEGT
ncbi:hypothetical protein [Streptomyces sp. NPDC059063]|uniref:hypothetical protein n=1 Tax=unclassified Streptomyces TaxID=2593676 RepID=UPI00368FEDA2